MGLSSISSRSHLSRAALRTQLAGQKGTTAGDLKKFDNTAGDSAADVVNISSHKADKMGKVFDGFASVCQAGLFLGLAATLVGTTGPLGGAMVAASTGLNLAGFAGGLVSFVGKKKAEGFHDKISRANQSAQTQPAPGTSPGGSMTFIGSEKAAPKTLTAFLS